MLIPKLNIMKVNKWLNSPSFYWGSFLIYCLWVIISAIQHEPNGDEYHVWGMVYDMNLSELWSTMSSEGHFITWHILQWPFVKWLGMDYHCIYIVSVSLMILAAWLLIFKLDFNIIGKLVILFSAPFCYYFPIVARCYALIPPILVGLAILYQKKEKPFLYCLLLGLLANTHAYIEGLVAILWCLFVYNQVYCLWKTNPIEAKRNLYASLITIAFVIFAFAQVVGGLISVEQGINPPGEGKNTLERWFTIYNNKNRFKLFTTLHDYFRFIPKLDVLATILLWIFVVIGSYECIKHSKHIKWQIICILFFGISWQIFFACNIYGMNWQRIHLPYFILVFVVWIIYEKGKKKWSNIALIAFWMLNTSSQHVMVKDFCQRKECDVEIAKQYDALITEDAPCYVDFFIGVHELMKHRFERVTPNMSDSTESEKILCSLTSKTGDCYLLLITRRLEIYSNNWHVDTLIYTDEWSNKLYYIKKNEEYIE